MKKLPLVLIPLSGAIYLFFACAWIHLPGLYYDEVLFANAALGNLDGLFVAWGIPLGGTRFPLMLMGYLGAVKAYLYFPLFFLFGTSPAVVRLPMILLGLGTLGFSYLWAKKMFGTLPALLTLILTATDPTFLFNHRLDWGPVALGLFLKAVSLYLLWKWLEEGKAWQLGTAAFACGVGLYDKALFLWFLIPLCLVFPLLYWQEIRKRWQWRTARLILLCFLAGCLPFLAYNLRGPFRTFRVPQLGNRTPLSNWAPRLSLAGNTLAGASAFYNVQQQSLAGYWRANRMRQDLFGRGVAAPARELGLEGSLLPWYFGISLAVLPIWLLTGRLPDGRAGAFLLLLLGGMAGTIYLSLAQATGQHHLVPVYPLPQLVVALALSGLAGPALVSGRGLGGVLLGVLLWGSQLLVNATYLDAFRKTGGSGLWSDSIYELAQFAREHPERDFYLLDWGFSNQLLLLTGGNIRKAEYFVPVREAGSPDREERVLLPWLRRPNTWFVLHGPGAQTYPALAIFERTLARYGLRRELVREVRGRDHKPGSWIYQVIDPAAEKVRVFREAEAWEGKKGGQREFKQEASLGAVLGGHWGKGADHRLAYRFRLDQPLAGGRFRLRYVFDRGWARTLELRIDGRGAGRISLPPTPGDGGRGEDWRLAELPLEPLGPGEHTLELRPLETGPSLNLDCWSISAGETSLPW